MEIIAVDDFPFDAFDRSVAQEDDESSKVAWAPDWDDFKPGQILSGRVFIGGCQVGVIR